MLVQDIGPSHFLVPKPASAVASPTVIKARALALPAFRKSVAGPRLIAFGVAAAWGVNASAKRHSGRGLARSCKAVPLASTEAPTQSELKQALESDAQGPGEALAQPEAEQALESDQQGRGEAVPGEAVPLDALLRLAAATDRGQRLTKETRRRAEELLEAVEVGNPTSEPARSPLLEGNWRLVFASEDVTRSSPFFWACRLLNLRDPTPFSSAVLGSDSLMDTTFAITDNIPLTKMGIAMQELKSGTLVSQVGVSVFITGESQMTTTCSYAPDPVDGSTLLVMVEKTQVLGNSMAANVLRDMDFPSGQWFKDALGEQESRVRMQISYLDEQIRIVRDARRPSACFVYARAD